MELVLVDPSPVFRTGLKTALTEVPRPDDLSVIAECSDCPSGAALASRLAPDLVISDLNLGDQNGIELARDLARSAPAVRLLILASYGPEVVVHQALAAGAAGYVLKSESAATIVAAIRSVGRGELVVPRGTSNLPRRMVEARAELDGLERLSQRERQVFDLVVWGGSNKQIAGRLGISIKTVETHRGHINRKLRLRTSADMVRLASLLGLLIPAPTQRAETGSNGVRTR